MDEASKDQIEILKDKLITLEKEIAKKNEQLLEYQKKINEYDYILDQIPANIFWKDKNLKYLGCNEPVIFSLGLNSKLDIINKDDSNEKLPWSHQSDVLKTNDLKVMSSGESIEFEETLNFANGIQTYLNIKTPLKDINGKIYGVIGVAIDITDRKELEEEVKHKNEELRQKDLIKTQFIENFSHDVKIPINALVGRTQLLKLIGQKEKNEKLIEVATDTENSAMVLDALFKQMQNIIIHEQFDNKIYNTTFNLFNLIDKEIEIIKASVPNYKSINIDFYPKEDELSIRVNTDYYKLSQIIRNLLSNAIKYTDEGNIDIQTEIIEENSKQVIFNFKVSDTGIGIDKAYQDNIFELFNRAGITSHDSNRHGMGIGLYIVKNNINILGGSVSFESYLGQGSKFFINIPLETV